MPAAQRPPLEPRQAADRLTGMSKDVRVAVLLEAGRPVEDSDPELAEAAAELLDAADAAVAGDAPAELELQLREGAVYAVRQGAFALAAVAGRGSLSSLVRWDMRAVLMELGAS